MRKAGDSHTILSDARATKKNTNKHLRVHVAYTSKSLERTASALHMRESYTLRKLNRHRKSSFARETTGIVATCTLSASADRMRSCTMGAGAPRPRSTFRLRLPAASESAEKPPRHRRSHRYTSEWSARRYSSGAQRVLMASWDPQI